MKGKAISKGLTIACAVLLLTACEDLFGPDPRLGVEAITTWNERANALVVDRPPISVPRSVRALTYLSIAQHRAVLEATAGSGGWGRPSVAAAVGRASVDVLSAFFSDDAGSLENSLSSDLESARRRGKGNANIIAGDAIGRAAAATVLALAGTDGAGSQDPGQPPTGTGFWVSADAPIVRGLYGARPFFMSSDQLVSPPPPAFDSDRFQEDLAEVRSISDTRTDEQIEAAEFWNSTSAPWGPVYFNRLAADLIHEHASDERQAARVLAYGNAAVFDALTACFHTKFEYWVIRPSQADPEITTPIGLPNHPSYPSAHACITDAFLTVLGAAFPSQLAEFEAISAESGMSRVLAGIHYRFDVEAGTEIGRAAGQLALAGALE